MAREKGRTEVVSLLEKKMALQVILYFVDLRLWNELYDACETRWWVT